MQITDKRIHQVKIELSLKECRNLRKAIDHYLNLYRLTDDPEKLYPAGEIDLVIVESARDPEIPKIRLGEIEERSNTLWTYDGDYRRLLELIIQP